MDYILQEKDVQIWENLYSRKKVHLTQLVLIQWKIDNNTKPTFFQVDLKETEINYLAFNAAPKV